MTIIVRIANMLSLVLALVLAFAVVFDSPRASAQATEKLWELIAQQKWNDARNIATAIDKQRGRGDIFLAYTDAAKFLNENKCEQAKKLATVVVNFEPSFLPAYDIITICLIREDNRYEAQQIVENIGNQLPDGPDKQYYLQWAKQLKDIEKITVNVDASITPSTNVTRRTARTTGFGGRISDDSRAQSGVIGFAQMAISKPMQVKNSSRIDGAIIPSIAYDTVTKTAYPGLGTSIRKTWYISKNENIFIEPRFTKTLSSDNKFIFSKDNNFLEETRLTIGYNKNINQTTFWANNINFIFRNFLPTELDTTRNNRDARRIAMQSTIQKNITQNNKITGSIYSHTDVAADKFYDETENNINIEWQHRFNNGFITSIGANAGNRKFDRIIPFSTEKRKDKFTGITIGLSNEKIQWKGVRPQLTFQVIRQKSNFIFDDFKAENLTVTMRKQF